MNTYTYGDQNEPYILCLLDNTLVVAWQSLDQDGSGWGVYAQKLDHQLNKQGGEVQVHNSTQDKQYKPSITQLQDGNLIITYKSVNRKNIEIRAQKFDKNLIKIGDEHVLKDKFKA